MMGMESVKVLNNLSKFKGTDGKGIKEPREFLEMFERVCMAHDFPERRWRRALALCFDAVDIAWLDEWCSQNFESTWDALQMAFLAHFQHPNTLMVL